MKDDESAIRKALADRYLIRQELGRGGMAVVFLAQELKHNRRVALKVLKPEVANTIGHERFIQEIRTTAQLNHPNILPLFDSGEAAGHVFYTMPYVDGESLRDRLQRAKRLSVADVLSIARQVCDALAYAHAGGVIHRDIKPDNIYIGARDHVWLADFGLAHALSSVRSRRMTGTGIAVGSPHYMSPEQAAGERDVDARSDIYSIGCVVFELLTGNPPFRGSDVASLLREHLVTSVPSIRDRVPNIPLQIDRAVQRALAKDPADRFDTIKAFQQALTQREAQPAAPVTDSGKASRTRGRDRTVVRIAIAYLVFAAGSIQLADPIAAALGLPPWTLTAVVIAAAVGVPIVIMLAWIYARRRTSLAAIPVSVARASLAATVPQAPPAPRVYEIDDVITPLIGREADLETAQQLLADDACRVLTLTGPGGIGKTRLAQEVALRASQRYAHGACFVALAGVEHAEFLPTAIADALELSLSPSENPGKQLAAFLQEKNLILVLDNFEQIVDGARLLADLIARAPGMRVVVTSRRRLRLAGENVLPLDALSLPLTADDLEAAAASVFFLQTAKRSDPRFAADSEAREAIARICHITAGVPLAIELAAASVGILSPTEIAHTLEESHDFILGARRDLAPRHQSLCAAFESSWRLLDSEERRAFRRLSVFRTKFDRDAAEAVAGAELALLARLVEVSLVRRPARGQFEILEVLRQFAEDKLVTNASEAAEVRRRHREYFLERLAALDALPDGPDRNTELERLAQHTTDLRTAWVDATNDHALNDLSRAAAGFFSLLQARGRSEEGASLFARAAETARLAAALKQSNAVDANRALARLITREASFITDLGRISEASELLSEGLTLLRAEPRPDQHEIAFAVFKQCNLARAKGDFTSPVFQESVELYRALDDKPGIARAMNALGTTRQALGDYAEAKRLYQECVQIWRSVGLDGEAWAALNNLSGLAEDEGDTTTARQILEAELEATRRRNNPRALSFLLTNLAYLCNSMGDRSAAEAYLREGIQVSRDMGYRTRLAYALNTLGNIQMDAGDAASAGTYREALKVAVETEEEPVITSILINSARVLLQRNDKERALKILKAVAAHPSCDERTRRSALSLITELDADAEPDAVTIPLQEAIDAALQADEPKVPARLRG